MFSFDYKAFQQWYYKHHRNPILCDTSEPELCVHVIEAAQRIKGKNAKLGSATKFIHKGIPSSNITKLKFLAPNTKLNPNGIYVVLDSDANNAEYKKLFFVFPHECVVNNQTLIVADHFSFMYNKGATEKQVNMHLTTYVFNPVNIAVGHPFHTPGHFSQNKSMPLFPSYPSNYKELFTEEWPAQYGRDALDICRAYTTYTNAIQGGGAPKHSANNNNNTVSRKLSKLLTKHKAHGVVFMCWRKHVTCFVYYDSDDEEALDLSFSWVAKRTNPSSESLQRRLTTELERVYNQGVPWLACARHWLRSPYDGIDLF